MSHIRYPYYYFYQYFYPIEHRPDYNVPADVPAIYQTERLSFINKPCSSESESVACCYNVITHYDPGRLISPLL